MTPNLTKLFAEATPGPFTDYIMSTSLGEIGQYVQDCVNASGGTEFYFISGPHPDGGCADVAHVGNGPRGKVNARKLAILANHGQAMIEALEHARLLLVDAANQGDPASAHHALDIEQLLAHLEQEAQS